MKWLSTLGIVIAVTAAAPVARAAPAGGARIVLLGARWCAPCMVEYRALDELVRAAAPDRIVLAWVDRPIPVPPALRGQVDAMPAEQALELARAVGGTGFGLPMAVRIPASGAPCRAWRAPLHAGQISALKAAC